MGTETVARVCGTRINHYQIRMSVFTPARRLPHRTAYYYVVSRPVSLGLSREVRGSHTHARTHRGTMPTQHDTHLHPSRPAHIASRMHHHSLHGRLPRTPTDPCTHPAAPHTRDAHGHITVIHTLPHSSPKSISELHLRRVAPSRVHLRRSRACKQHTDSAAE